MRRAIGPRAAARARAWRRCSDGCVGLRKDFWTDADRSGRMPVFQESLEHPPLSLSSHSSSQQAIEDQSQKSSKVGDADNFDYNQPSQALQILEVTIFLAHHLFHALSFFQTFRRCCSPGNCILSRCFCNIFRLLNVRIFRRQHLWFLVI